LRDIPTIETADDVAAAWAALMADPPYLRRKAEERAAGKVRRRHRRQTKSFPRRRARWRKQPPITHAELLALLEYRESSTARPRAGSCGA
jgi:hypothetical protein